MPYRVRELVKEDHVVVSVRLTDTLKHAIEVMIEHDYSQLPVIDEAKQPLGMITGDSILRAASHFGLPPSDLPLADARLKVEPKQLDEDLFEVLNYLQDNPAVLIVNQVGELCGIVTDYDIASYFRERVEDIMNVQDIEGYLKDYVLETLRNDAGELNELAQTAAIQEVTPSSKELRGKFRQATNTLLALERLTDVKLSQRNIEQAFAQHFEIDILAKPFDRLNMSDYVELFLHKNRWPKFAPMFLIPPGAVRKLLEDVRDTRNDLSHFRAISQGQRQKLRYCREWFARRKAYNQAPLEMPAEVSEIMSRDEVEPIPVVLPGHDGQVQRIETDVLDKQPPNAHSYYEELGRYLQRQEKTQRRVELTFTEIEKLLRGRLPVSAYQHRLWWANDRNNSQAQQWLEAGWAVTRVSSYEETVTFEPIKARGGAYIDFYNNLLNSLRGSVQFELEDVSPDGKNWITIAYPLTNASFTASMGFHDSSKEPFSMGINLIPKDIGVTERVYSLLSSRKVDIERELGEQLNFEGHEIRLPYLGGITASDEQLIDWAVQKINDFHRVLTSHLLSVVNSTK